MPSIFSSSKGSSSSPRPKKCTKSCGFLNLPQASEGTYQCHGSKKNGQTPCRGTYEVTRAEATLVMDLHRAQMRKEESEAYRQKSKGKREGHVGSASTLTHSSGKGASGRHGKPLPPTPLEKDLPGLPQSSSGDQDSHSLPLVLSRQSRTPKRNRREELALGPTWQNALNMGVPSTSAKGGYNPELEVKERVKAQAHMATIIQPGDNRRSMHPQLGHFPIPEVLLTEGQSWYREAPPPLPTETWYPKRN